MWDINLRKKSFYKYLTPNGGLKFACFLPFSGVLEKLFTHFTEVKHTLAFCFGQNSPMGSVRQHLMEPFGGFSAWSVHLGREERNLYEKGIPGPTWLPNGQHLAPAAVPAHYSLLVVSLAREGEDKIQLLELNNDISTAASQELHRYSLQRTTPFAGGSLQGAGLRPSTA